MVFLTLQIFNFSNGEINGAVGKFGKVKTAPNRTW
jgi:hypothetical protein